jgi:hypothetical protein
VPPKGYLQAVYEYYYRSLRSAGTRGLGGLTSLPIHSGTFDGRAECASPTKCRPGSDELARIFGRSKRKAWCPTL